MIHAGSQASPQFIVSSTVTRVCMIIMSTSEEWVKIYVDNSRPYYWNRRTQKIKNEEVRTSWAGKKDTPSGCFYFWRVNCSEQCSWRYALCCRHNQRLLHSAHALGGMPGKNSIGNGLQRFLDQVLQTARIDNMRLLEIHFLLQLLHVLELTCMHKVKCRELPMVGSW